MRDEGSNPLPSAESESRSDSPTLAEWRNWQTRGAQTTELGSSNLPLATLECGDRSRRFSNDAAVVLV